MKAARVIKQALRQSPTLGECLTQYADLTRAFTVRVPCVAEWLFEPQTHDQLTGLWGIMQQEGAAPRILGGGTNTIPVEEFLTGVTISLRRLVGVDHSRIDEGIVYVLGGTPLQTLCRDGERNRLAGLEGLAGVPGTVAGALVMNAGGRNGCIGEWVEWVEVLEPDGGMSVLSREEAGFAYRHSSLTGGRLVVAAGLRLPSGDPEAMRARRLEVARQKRAAQPLGARSAGCFFKNPEDGRSTGLLMQQAGLKGARVGGAACSTHHSNFLVNDGGARGADFVELADLVRRRIRQEHGLELKEEVKLWR